MSRNIWIGLDCGGKVLPSVEGGREGDVVSEAAGGLVAVVHLLGRALNRGRGHPGAGDHSGEEGLQARLK